MVAQRRGSSSPSWGAATSGWKVDGCATRVPERRRRENWAGRIAVREFTLEHRGGRRDRLGLELRLAPPAAAACRASISTVSPHSRAIVGCVKWRTGPAWLARRSQCRCRGLGNGDRGLACLLRWRRRPPTAGTNGVQRGAATGESEGDEVARVWAPRFSPEIGCDVNCLAPVWRACTLPCSPAARRGRGSGLFFVVP